MQTKILIAPCLATLLSLGTIAIPTEVEPRGSKDIRGVGSLVGSLGDALSGVVSLIPVVGGLIPSPNGAAITPGIGDTLGSSPSVKVRDVVSSKNPPSIGGGGR